MRGGDGMAMGDDSVTVSINGESTGLQAAIQQAIAGLESLAEEADALSASTGAAAAGLAGSDGASGMVGALAATSAAAADTEDALGSAGAAAEESGGLFAGLSGILGGAGDGVAAVMGGAGDAAGLLGGAFGSLAGMAGGFAERAGSIAALVLGFDVFNMATGWVSDFSQGLFQLNATMQQTEIGWGFMFGKMRDINGQFTDVTGSNQQLMNWTMQASLNMPFTRQDINSGISALAVSDLFQGNPDLVEQFVPYLSDLASTKGMAAYGGRGMTFQMAAFAIAQAMMGNTRMLRRDLMINPEDLIKYGLKGTVNSMGNLHIEDPSTFVPALEAYVKGQGLAGASQAMTTQTWSGAWSSFLDRIQNFEITAGGKFFKDMLKDLNGLSDWLTQHNDELQKFAQLMGTDVANAFERAATFAGDFFTGLQNSGLLMGLGFKPTPPPPPPPQSGKDAKTGKQIVPWNFQGPLDNKTQERGQKPPTPPTPSFGENLGHAIGNFLEMLGKVKDANLPNIEQDLKGFGDAWSQLTKQLGFGQGSGGSNSGVAGAADAVAQALLSLPFGLVDAAVMSWTLGFHLLGKEIGTVGWVLGLLGDEWHALTTNDPTKALNDLRDAVQGVGNAISDLVGHLNDFLGSIFPASFVHQVEQDIENMFPIFKQGTDNVNGLANAFTNLGKLKDQVGTAFQNGIVKPLTDGIHTITQSALHWGQDLVTSFINGIEQKAGDLKDAVTNAIANPIAALLHHSTPDEGPLAGDDQWMPDMIDLLTLGILAGVPKVASATAQLAAQIAGPLQQTAGNASGYGAQVGGGLATGLAASGPHTSYGDTTIHQHIHAVSEARTQQLITTMLRGRDTHGNLMLRQPGGFRRPGAIGGLG